MELLHRILEDKMIILLVPPFFMPKKIHLWYWFLSMRHRHRTDLLRLLHALEDMGCYLVLIPCFHVVHGRNVLGHNCSISTSFEVLLPALAPGAVAWQDSAYKQARLYSGAKWVAWVKRKHFDYRVKHGLSRWSRAGDTFALRSALGFLAATACAALGGSFSFTEALKDSRLLLLRHQYWISGICSTQSCPYCHTAAGAFEGHLRFACFPRQDWGQVVADSLSIQMNVRCSALGGAFKDVIWLLTFFAL